jgi:hypothetical protein
VSIVNIVSSSCVLITVPVTENDLLLSPIYPIVEDSIRIWHDCSSESPAFERSYSPAEQRAREGRIDCCLASIEAKLENKSFRSSGTRQAIAEIIPLMTQITADSLEFEHPYVDTLLNQGLADISFDLVHRARALDPTVTMVDIFQAARNAWTACALQLVFGHPMRLTPSIFAYSMLYPYSDNYLDDVAVSPESKLRFSQRFRQRLEGDSLAARDAREALIWELVRLIESEYPRDAFTQVYTSLLAIHSAQQESIEQLHGRLRTAVEIAELTITKGGTSVLADAYLAAGHLTDTEAHAAFNWGVVLQLGDDLQDFRSDRKRGSLTLFTHTAAREPLDRITSQTFNFSRVVMNELAQLSTCPSVLKELLARSSRLLLIRSAAAAPEHFTTLYLSKLQNHSPFGFEFLRARERRVARRRRSYSRLFEQAAATL